MKNNMNKYINTSGGRKNLMMKLNCGFVLSLILMLIFSFTHVKAAVYESKISCCGKAVESVRAASSESPELTESCPCCGGICRCNFSDGIPVNNTDMDISPRSSYNPGDTPVVLNQNYFQLEHVISLVWSSFNPEDYGESVPLYILKSSLLFYH